MLQGTSLAEDLEDLYENAPCGYFSLSPDGLIVKVNQTFCEWTGFSKDQLLGRRLRDLLNVGGRIFYETHFAPLLRMQGFFNEVALDVMTAAGDRLPVLANAKERRAANGDLLFTRVTIFLAAERRRYERGLVDARAAADATSRELTDAGWRRRSKASCASSSSRSLATTSAIRLPRSMPAWACCCGSSRARKRPRSFVSSRTARFA